MRAEHTLALHKHKCSYTHTHSPSHTPLRALIHSYAHVHPHTRGFKCCRAFIVIVFTKVWRAAERLSKSKHRGYNEYVGVHYGRKSTQEERTCWRSIGAWVFKCCVVIGETASLHFLYENTAKSQLSVLCSLDKVVWYTSYKTLNISPRALAAYLFGCVLWSCSSQLPKQLDYPCLPCVSPAHALPMFREARQRSTRKQLEKDRLDPRKSHKPEPPVSGPGNVSFLFFFFFLLSFICAKHEHQNKQENRQMNNKCPISVSGRRGKAKTEMLQILSFKYEDSNKVRLQFCSCFESVLLVMFLTWMNAWFCLRQMYKSTVVDVLRNAAEVKIYKSAAPTWPAHVTFFILFIFAEI